MEPAEGRSPRVGMFLPTGGIDMMGGRNPRWSDLLAMTRRAEEVGFDFVAVLDHLTDYWEGWSLLAALAASTSRITLVSYVTCTSYRNPALLAKIADTVDEISDGRLIFGLGAGDSDAEHHSFGYPRDKPVSRFAEAVGVVTTLLREGRIDHDGVYYQARDCELRPRGPREQGPPILVGALGGERMLRLTVRHADIHTTTALDTGNRADALPALVARVDAACRAAGRDPASLERWAEVTVELPSGRGRTRAWTEMPPVTGTADQIAHELRAYAQHGIDAVNVWIEPNDLSGIEQFVPVLQALGQHR
jgi:alkanesulfonate monooxygenase SsuD/methylene tetrahydromethanopterin reductase-like flavin-dependent oxidoreductase (luciferase family)